MNAIQAIVLGIVQGLAEFLPISSSGHLMLAQKLMGIQSPGLLLEVLLHVGTLIAVLIVFWRDWLDILRNPFRSRTLGMLVIATVPAVIATLLFGDALDSIFEGWFLGISFLITAVILLSAEWLSALAAKKQARHVADQGLDAVKPKHALAMGCMQAVAILPGVSRSGSTIVGGVASGLTRKTAARFSFMMSAVAIVGSLVFMLKDLAGAGSTALGGNWFAMLLGVLAAAISGYMAIRWMLALIQRVSLKWFALYVAIIGFLVLCDQLMFGVFFEKII